MFRLPLAVLLALLAGTAHAQSPSDPAEARAQMFDGRGVVISIQAHPFLSDADVAALSALPKVAQLKYYGAMAAHPSDGLQAQRTRGAFNFHSVETARAAALSGCGTGCVIVADILPRGYRPGRALTLNQDASEALTGRDFRRAGRNAALAVSRSTGAWGLGDGGRAAVATCAAQGATDCDVAVGR